MAEVRKNTMDNAEAEELIYQWGDILEVDTERDFFKDTVNEIRISVKKGRLTFDEDEEVFKYLLISPIEAGQNSETISMINIKECDMNSKRVIQKFKENESIDTSEAMISKYIGIHRNRVSGMKDRDITKINAVILGFFVQAATSEK